MADSRGVNLDEDLIWLDVVEVDLLELELAVELGDDEGCGDSRHGCLLCEAIFGSTVDEMTRGWEDNVTKNCAPLKSELLS